MVAAAPASDRAEADPALLAFVKCHLTSFARWEVLRVLAEAPGRWTAAAGVAAASRRPLGVVIATLDELAREDLLERGPGPGEARYRLDPLGPTACVLQRLIERARRSQGLRRIIVARILGAAAPVGPENGHRPAAGPCPRPAAASRT